MKRKFKDEEKEEKMKDKRVMVFIDGANLYRIAKSEGCNADVKAIQNLVNNLTHNYELIRVYYYTAIPDQTRELKSYRNSRIFLDALEKLDCFEVCLGKLRYPSDAGKPHQKGVDVKMATDMLEYANRDLYDIAILVSGDGDFAYVLPFIKGKGKQIMNATFKRGLSYELRQKSDFFREIDCSWLK